MKPVGGAVQQWCIHRQAGNAFSESSRQSIYETWRFIIVCFYWFDKTFPREKNSGEFSMHFSIEFGPLC